MSNVDILGGAPPPSVSPFGPGSHARLRELVVTHEAPLKRFLARLGLRSAELEDAVQEVLIVTARKLDQVRPGSERAFLFATAERVSRNARRGSSRRMRVATTLFESGAFGTVADGPGNDLLGRALLDDALAEMPEDVLRVFFLAELEEMPIPMVAQQLGLPDGTVASRLRRARAHFEVWASRVRATMEAERQDGPSPRKLVELADPEILSWWVQRGEADALRALIGVYERSHPCRRSIMSATLMGTVPARAELSSRMLRGTPPDTFQVNGGNALRSWVRRTATGDQMDPIDFLFAEEGWAGAFAPDVLDLVSHRGHFYAVPLDIHRTNMLFFNERIFAEQGLRAPGTLEELYSVAEDLRARGVAPLAMGFREPWTLTMLAFETVLVGEAGPEYYKDLFGGRRGGDDVEIRGALAHVSRLLDLTSADAPMLGWDGALDVMMRGGAGMTMAGDWGKGYLVSKGYRVGEDFGVLPSPARSKAFVFATDVFGLPKRAAHRTDALELLKVFGSKRGQDAFSRLKGSMPARLDIDISGYDASAQSSFRDFRQGVRVPSMASLVPTAFSRMLDAAMAGFAITRDASAVVAAIQGSYDLLKR